jgi:hypothetical protein
MPRPKAQQAADAILSGYAKKSLDTVLALEQSIISIM